MSLFLRVAGGIFATVIACAASAQATRTWVSGVGDDANPCSRTAPCKTFAGAISKTAAKGEISVLDPGGYGAVTITKSITIDGGGTLAGITNSGTNGIIISAGTADHVVIRNVSIFGASSGGINGVRVLQAASVTLENVSIERQTLHGIDFVPINTDARLQLRNVTIREIVGAALTSSGINATSAVTGASAYLENVSISGYPIGLNAGENATIHLDRSNVINNGTGIKAAFATALVRLSDSTVTGNTTGLSYATTLPPPAPDTPGQIISYNNNRLRGNTTDGAPTSAVYTR
jgi:hypothetical protein